MENEFNQHNEPVVKNCKCSYYKSFNGRSWCIIGYGRGECEMDCASSFHKKIGDKNGISR